MARGGGKDIHVEVSAKEIKDRFHKPSDMSIEDYDKAAFDKMLKKFNRKCIKTKHLDKYREHTYFISPSLKKHHIQQTNDYLREHGWLESKDKKDKEPLV